MSKVLNRRSYKADDIVFREGEQGSHAYVVQSGQIAIEKEDKNGNTIKLGTVKNGAIFGEMALVDDRPRMAGARAEVPTVLIAIPKEVLQTKLKNADPVIRMLILMMIRMIRTVAEHGGLGEAMVDELVKAAEDG